MFSTCAGTARAEFMGKRNNSMYCYKHAQRYRYADKENVGGRLDRTGEASFTTMLPNEVLVGLGGG